MKKLLAVLVTLLFVLSSVLFTYTATKDYMIHSAEPNFSEHTIEWDGQVHSYN